MDTGKGSVLLKTTIKKMDYEQVMALPRPAHRLPAKPSFFWQTIVRAIWLGFSEGYELSLCVGFGYANETPEAKPRNVDKVRFVD